MIIQEYMQRKESLAEEPSKDAAGGKISHYFKQIEKSMFPRTQEPSPKSGRLNRLNLDIKANPLDYYEQLA